MFQRKLGLKAIAGFAVLLVGTAAFAGDPYGHERANFRAAVKFVASDIEKNFYDPNLKGLDWKTVTEEAKAKIEKANNPGEMIVAIYVMVNKLNDSHTQFRPPSRSLRLFFGFDAKAVGDDIRIYELKADDPADRAGLQVGDKIVKVNGFNADRATFDLMMLDMRVLRPRSVLDLVVQTGNDAPRAVHLEARRKQEANLLGEETRMGDIWSSITEDENYAQEHQFETGHFDNVIGYIWLREFPAEGGDFLKGLGEKVKDSKALVIDLRTNPGGELECFKTFTGMFEQQETTLMNMVSRKGSKPLTVKPQRPNFQVPNYILVDSRTGSAAEFFARHMQRTGKAVVIGDHTPGRANWSRYFGNSSGAENVMPYGTQISTDRAVFPDGEEVEHKGITPDVYCIPTGEQMQKENDVCLNKALDLARTKLGIKPAITETK